MTDQPINPRTLQSIEDYLTSPGQAIGLIGPKWLSKQEIATLVASELLNIPIDSLSSHPYLLNISGEEKGISIEDIRSLNDFLILKVPSDEPINRVVIISRAETMKLEAQNALLKNLEEPPRSTVIILTAESESALLPTILSRIHVIKVYKPDKKDLEKYYLDQGYKVEEIKQAILISDRLPALTELLLSTKDSPINIAVEKARKLLTSTTYERLNTVNELKDKQEVSNILFIIKQMSKIGVNSETPASSLRWRKILQATLDSESKLLTNVQLKLLLTDYMLAIA